jgi:hypothetical protein
MTTRRDEQWLDGELRRTINTRKPEFDAEAWKRNHAEAYEALTSRRSGTCGVGIRTRRRVRPFVGMLAAAAVIVVGVAILLTQRLPHDQQRPVIDASAKAPSPAHIVSMISLRTAYRQGGEEALNQQLDTALNTLGPRPSGLSALKILSDLES